MGVNANANSALPISPSLLDPPRLLCATAGSGVRLHSPFVSVV
jgi:hypothetical protein